MIQNQGCRPEEAWKAAAEEFFSSSASLAKNSSPKSAFLGLCGAGLVQGVMSGDYTKSLRNKEHAIRAVEILEQNPMLASVSAEALWGKVLDGYFMVHGYQMNVVLGLWNAGLITKKEV